MLECNNDEIRATMGCGGSVAALLQLGVGPVEPDETKGGEDSFWGTGDEDSEEEKSGNRDNGSSGSSPLFGKAREGGQFTAATDVMAGPRVGPHTAGAVTWVIAAASHFRGCVLEEILGLVLERLAGEVGGEEENSEAGSEAKRGGLSIVVGIEKGLSGGGRGKRTRMQTGRPYGLLRSAEIKVASLTPDVMLSVGLRCIALLRQGVGNGGVARDVAADMAGAAGVTGDARAAGDDTARWVHFATVVSRQLGTLSAQFLRLGSTVPVHGGGRRGRGCRQGGDIGGGRWWR